MTRDNMLGTFWWNSTLRNILYICATSHIQLINFSARHVLSLTMSPSPFHLMHFNEQEMQKKKSLKVAVTYNMKPFWKIPGNCILGTIAYNETLMMKKGNRLSG